MRWLLVVGMACLVAGCSPERVPRGVAQYRGDVQHLGDFPGEVLSSRPVRQAYYGLVNSGVHTASKSSPTAYGDTVYVGADSGTLYALDRRTLSVRWTFDVRQTASHGIHATPAVDDKRVYIGGYDGWMYALDRNSGALLWQQHIGDAIGSSAVLRGGRLYVGVEVAGDSHAEGFVAALQQDTGRLVFQSPRLGGEVHCTPSLSLARRLMFSGCNGSTFYGLSIDTGNIAWRFQTQGPIKGTAAAYDDFVLFTSWDGALYCLAQADGHLVWRVPTSSKSQSSPTIDAAQRRVYFAGTDRVVRCVGLDDGHSIWTHVLPKPTISSCTLTRDDLLIGCNDGIVYALNPSNGETRFELGTQGPVTSVPTVDDGDVFINGNDGLVYRFR